MVSISVSVSPLVCKLTSMTRLWDVATLALRTPLLATLKAITQCPGLLILCILIPCAWIPLSLYSCHVRG